MPIIQRPDLVSKVRKEYELLGPDAIATISPELVAVVVVDDISEKQADTSRFAIGGYTLLGVAANYSHVGLYNPADSGALLFVVRVIIAPDTNNYWEIRRDGGLTNTSSQFQLLDRRLTPANPVGQIRYENNVAKQGQVCGIVRGRGNMNDSFDLPWVLDEQQGINLGPATANTTSTVTFVWRELYK